MKYLFTLLFLSQYFLFSQQYIAIPDDSFEQHLINEGYDDVMDNYVSVNNIMDVVVLDLSNLLIEDLTGIEFFNSFFRFIQNFLFFIGISLIIYF